MKKFLLLALLICGCVPTEDKARAHKAAENYVRQLLDNPHFFQSVSFSELEKRRYTTALDSDLNNAGIKGDDYKKIEKYVDSENAQRPDISTQNLKNMDDIKHDRLIYYTMTYSFRIDSNGFKKLMRYRFELDTGYNVLKAKDITNDRSKVQ
jgi:hypothetical protein